MAVHEPVNIGVFAILQTPFSREWSLCADISLGAEQLSELDGSAGGAAQRVVRQADELVVIGNNAIGLYDAYGKYSTDAKYDGVAGIVPSTMPNLGLTWEVSTQLDAGFDLSMFNNRLNISADYFDKRTDNLLFSKELPNTSGFANVQTNIGKVKFYGFDVEISYTNIETKDFIWSILYLFGYLR